MKLHLKRSRGYTSESVKARVVIVYATHCHDLFYIIVKYYDNKP